MTGKELGQQLAYPDGTRTNLGLTKREEFAKVALSMWKIDNDDVAKLVRKEIPNHGLAARFCIGIADALLEELAKEAR